MLSLFEYMEFFMKQNLSKWNISKIYTVMLVLLIFGIFEFGRTNLYGFIAYPDEFGYWATAAKLVGYDWSRLASLGSYYSFGYSLILAPILYLTKGGLAAYQCAVFANFLLMFGAAILLRKCVQELYPQMEEKTAFFITLLGVLFPSWICYNQTTFTEGVLYFLFILSYYCMFRITRTEQNFVWYIILLFTLSYMYMVHMRTIGILIAACISLCFVGWKKPKDVWKIFFLIAGLIIIAIVSTHIKQAVQNSVFRYGENVFLEHNDYGGQVHKLKNLSSIKSLINLVILFLGRLAYLTAASWGMLVVFAVNYLKQLFFKNDVNSSSLYILLSVLGMAGVSSIFSWGEVHGINQFMYGRYSEFVLPIVIVLGYCYLREQNMTGKALLSYIMPVSIIWAFGLCILWIYQLTNIRPLHSLALGFFQGTDLSEQMQVLLCFAAAMLAFIGLILGQYFDKRFQGKVSFLVLFFLVELFVAFTISNHIVYGNNIANHQQLNVVELIREKQYQKIQYLISEETVTQGSFYQFYLPEMDIEPFWTDKEDLILEEIDGDIILVNREMELSAGVEAVLKKNYPEFRAIGVCGVYYK